MAGKKKGQCKQHHGVKSIVTNILLTSNDGRLLMTHFGVLLVYLIPLTLYEIILRCDAQIANTHSSQPQHLYT